MTYDEAQTQAIAAAQAAMIQNYDAARKTLADKGVFGKELDRKARKLALKIGGFELPENWTIAMVTPKNWGQNNLGYRAQTAQQMQQITSATAFCAASARLCGQMVSFDKQTRVAATAEAKQTLFNLSNQIKNEKACLGEIFALKKLIQENDR